MKYRKMIILTASILVASLMFIAFQLLLNTSTLAQNTDSTATPIVIPTLDETPGSIPTLDIARDGFTFSNDPSNYTIVYVTVDGAIEDNSLISEDKMSQVAQMQIVHTNEELYSIDLNSPIEAIVIHASAYETVDRGWIADASRRGVIVAGINLHFAEIAELIDSECARQQAREKINPFRTRNQDYYYVDSAIFLTKNPDEQLALEVAVYDTCGIPQVTERVYNFSRGSHGPFRGELDVLSFTELLISHIEGIRSARKAFEASLNGVPPTPVPDISQLQGGE